MKRKIKSKVAKSRRVSRSATPKKVAKVVRREGKGPAPKLHKFAGRRTSAPPANPDPVAPTESRMHAMAAADLVDLENPGPELPQSDDGVVEVRTKTGPSAARKELSWDDLNDLEIDESPPSPAPQPAARKVAPTKQAPQDDDAEQKKKPETTSHAKSARENDDHIMVTGGDDTEALAKFAGKFNLGDIEALKAIIKVKGTSRVVNGINFEELKWDAAGLLPIIAQDRRTGAVLQLAWMNRDTLEKSLKSGQMTYFDPQRNKAVTKGEDGGHAQRLHQLQLDCDKDAILAVVEQNGPCCHRDTGTCWSAERAIPAAGFMGELDHRAAATMKAARAHGDVDPIPFIKELVTQANETVQSLLGKSAVSVERTAADMLTKLVMAARAKGVSLDRVLTEGLAGHMAEENKLTT